MATTPIYGWSTPDNTGLVKNGALDIRTLGNAIDTTMATMTPKSLVDAKGDLIAATANDTPARLAVGNNGETLVADSSTSTGLRYQGSTAAGRNFVINGGFDIWQRGTSFTGANSNTYTADRWNMYFGVTPTAYTISRQSSGLTGFPYAIRVQRNNGATDTIGGAIGSSIEIANATYLAGQNVVFSFYARKGALFSQASSIVTASLKTGTGTTDANGIYNTYTGEVTPISQNTTLTTSWQRFSYTATLGSSVTQVAIQFNAGASGTAGATDYYEIAGVQVEVGSVATQFTRAGGTLQGELAACQRYYYRQGGLNTYQTFGGGFADQTTTAIIQVPLPATMRVAPTSVDFSTLNLSTGGTNTAVTSLTILSNNSGNGIAVVYPVVASGLTANRPYSLTANNSTNGFLGLSAEL